MGCYIWYSEEGPGRDHSPPRPLLSVPNVTAHPPTASVPITVLLYVGPLLHGYNVAIKGSTVKSATAARERGKVNTWNATATAGWTSCSQQIAVEAQVEAAVAEVVAVTTRHRRAHPGIQASSDITTTHSVHFFSTLTYLLCPPWLQQRGGLIGWCLTALSAQ